MSEYLCKIIGGREEGVNTVVTTSKIRLFLSSISCKWLLIVPNTSTNSLFNPSQDPINFIFLPHFVAAGKMHILKA